MKPTIACRRFRPDSPSARFRASFGFGQAGAAPTLALLLCVTLGTAPILAAEATAAEPMSRAKKALYLGIDGMRFDAATAAQTPNLDKLIRGGIVADNCLILGERYQGNDTISGPGWSTILTGVWADKHGVNDNTFRGRNYERYPHLFTLLKKQQPSLRTASLVTWKPIDDYIVRDADVRQAWGDETKDYAGYDASAAKAAVEVLGDPELDCLFLYFGQVDETGHASGFHPTVKPYLDAIQRVDQHIGEVLIAIESRKSYQHEDWLIVVTSDHGGKGTGHGKGHQVPEILNSFLIVSGESADRGRFSEQTYLVDAAVTVLAHLGVRPEPDWQLDGTARGLKPQR